MKLAINDIAKALNAADMTTDVNADVVTDVTADDIIDNVSIDSRSTANSRSTLFVALRTRNNDGHDYIRDLVSRGVRNFVVDHIPSDLPADSGANFIVVDDTLAALQAIGAYCRKRLGCKVIGITGSRGKTLVKEWIYQALAPESNVGRSPRSYNSQIGVPLSLTMLDDDTRLAVIEAGISKSGEMERLEPIIAPEIGILTQITDEHDSGFASREEKIREKVKLFKASDTIIYDSRDAEAERIIKATYPDRRLIGVDIDPALGAEGMKGVAAAALRLLGRDESLLSRCHPIETRLNVIDGTNNCQLIRDRFTADIASLRGALEFLNRQVSESSRRTLLLATDGFIGDSRDIAKAVTDYRIDRLITVGSSRPEPSELPSSVRVEHHASPGELSADDFYNETILLRDTPSTSFTNIYNTLEAKQHETVMEVNLDAMVSNFNFFRSKVKPETGIICMLKAHGYGAGSIELARTLQGQGAAYLAVAVVDEGIELRQAGVTVPIMVLNPRAQSYKAMFDYHLEPEIYSFDILDKIVESAARYEVKGFPVHIKLDTGMRRLGFRLEDIDRLAERLNGAPEVKASTVFSHLACADDPQEDDYTRGQFEYFDRCCDRLDALLNEKPRRHILNSTGILRFAERQYDFVRLGIGLYGVPTLFDGSEDALRNVSSLKSVIISLKHWRKGDTVGYNRRGRLDRDSVIATVPVGYADGIDRHLGYGNTAMVVNGHRCPTVGSICMDICMIDVTDVDCAVGDSVEIFGDNVTPIELADKLTTIPYEILTSISPRVKRVYYRE